MYSIYFQANRTALFYQKNTYKNFRPNIRPQGVLWPKKKLKHRKNWLLKGGLKKLAGLIVKASEIAKEAGPHQSCQPNLNITNVKWKTRWEGRYGITPYVIPAYRCWELDQLFIRWHPNKDLKWTKLGFGPI